MYSQRSAHFVSFQKSFVTVLDVIPRARHFFFYPSIVAHKFRSACHPLQEIRESFDACSFKPETLFPDALVRDFRPTLNDLAEETRKLGFVVLRDGTDGSNGIPSCREGIPAASDQSRTNMCIYGMYVYVKSVYDWICFVSLFIQYYERREVVA